MSNQVTDGNEVSSVDDKVVAESGDDLNFQQLRDRILQSHPFEDDEK